jgi:predicted nucleotidyltransferase
MPKQPIELMFGSYRRQLLATLLLRPGERFHVRELGRMTGFSPGSIHRELKVLAESGLLRQTRVGNQVHYQSNPDCPIFEELASIFRKTAGLADLLQGALHELAETIDIAFVFGSMATGRQVPSSDVDVMVLGNVQLFDVVKALSSLSEVLGREINPVVMTTETFVVDLGKKKRFATNIMSEQKVFVIGSEREFAKLAQDQSAR